MKKIFFFIIKSLIFLFILAIVVNSVNLSLRKKYWYRDLTPTTISFHGFYQMEFNTVDVLFLGSSHAACGFNPQDLYDYSGIKSYNLASNGQPLWLSYYWLKEALNYQSPKVVVLDGYCFFGGEGQDESICRMALDDMRWGEAKKEAIDTVCGYDKSQSWLSYLLTNIRFHARWEEEIGETDFLWGDIYKTSKLKGFNLFRDVYKYTTNYVEYTPLEITDSPKEPFQVEAKKYLDKIVNLCKENNIKLILVKTPAPSETLERHNAIADYADRNQLKFYDFNENQIFEEIKFDYADDMNDSSNSGPGSAHANPSGARKITRYLGDVLQREYGIEGSIDWQWESTREFNEGIWKDFLLHNETDISEYLTMLQDERYTIFMVAKGTEVIPRDEKLQNQLRQLGLEKVGWYDASSQSYIAVIESGKMITEIWSGDPIEKTGSFQRGKAIYKVMSEGSGYDCSIQIHNFGEVSQQKYGLNIVVYNNELKTVIDSVCFDVNKEDDIITRKIYSFMGNYEIIVTK